MGSDTPFRHWVLDQFCETIQWDDLPSPTWAGWEVHYDNDQERSKYTTRDLSSLPRAFSAIALRLNHSAPWSAMAGIELRPDTSAWGGGAHIMQGGGWLQIHLDWAIRPPDTFLERRMTLVGFLHPEWKPEWGGRFILANPDGSAHTRIDPLPGRLIAFENSDLSYHGVEQLAEDAPPRVSFMATLLGPARPRASRRRALFIPNRNSPECPKEVK